jgi:hypothetical protein
MDINEMTDEELAAYDRWLTENVFVDDDAWMPSPEDFGADR